MNNKNTRFTLLIILQAIALILIILLLINDPIVSNDSNLPKLSADKLHAAGLLDEAIHLYEKSFFSESSNNQSNQLSLAMTLGELYTKQGLNEKALSWFYMAEGLNPDSEKKKIISKNIVSLLEKLGKHSFSKLSLEEKTTLNSNPKDLNAKLLAKVGDKNIYDTDLRDLLDNFQNYSKQKIDKSMKLQLLQKLVADELLYQKAQRLNISETDEFKKKINQISKDIMVELVLKDEVHKKIDTSTFKLKKYYEENQDKFNIPESFKIAYVTTKEKNESEKWLSEIKKGKSLKSLSLKGLTEHTLSSLSPLASMDSNKTKELISLVEKNKTGSLLHNGQYYIFELLTKIPGKKNSYDEVKDQVKNVYQMNEAQNLYQEMIQGLIEQENVKIFAENINE